MASVYFFIPGGMSRYRRTVTGTAAVDLDADERVFVQIMLQNAVIRMPCTEPMKGVDLIS